MDTILKQAEDLFDYTRSLRRDFHRHPELGFKEVRTAGIVARELNALGMEVSTGIAETGVIASLEGEQPGPVVLMRFDMDALPIQEETGAEYASGVPNVMHACGHDGHTAIGLTAARLLNDRRKELAGTLKFVFQPAEEGLGGAERMIAEGVLGEPRPNFSLCLHLWNEEPFGWLGITPGPMMAAAEIFQITLQGQGGHAALPHQGLDPVLAAAQVVNVLQGIVSRNVSPLEGAVISVTSIHGGEAFNVIPSTVDLKGTIRTFDAGVRQTVLERFRAVASGVSRSAGCQAQVEVTSLTPAVVNDDRITQRAQEVASRLFPDFTLDINRRTMVSEDMAFMMQQVPGCYLLVGSANPEKGLNARHHNPRFDFDERALVTGVALIASVAVELLR
jgi:amidohydrolase